MQIICIVDSINNLKTNINTLQFHFGENIKYVVKAEFVPLFKTFEYPINAIFGKNLSSVLTKVVSSNDDLVLYRTSLDLNYNLINRFLSHTNKGKAVNIIPKYNFFEQFGNSVYNTYVNSVFKIKDSLASNKLQYLPAGFVAELLDSHFANKLFELNPSHVINIYIEDNETSKALKTKTNFTKQRILFAIISLAITIALILSMAFFKINFLFVFIYIMAYTLDVCLAILFKCKAKFDNRFLN